MDNSTHVKKGSCARSKSCMGNSDQSSENSKRSLEKSLYLKKVREARDVMMAKLRANIEKKAAEGQLITELKLLKDEIDIRNSNYRRRKKIKKSSVLDSILEVPKADGRRIKKDPDYKGLEYDGHDSLRAVFARGARGGVFEEAKGSLFEDSGYDGLKVSKRYRADKERYIKGNIYKQTVRGEKGMVDYSKSE